MINYRIVMAMSIVIDSSESHVWKGEYAGRGQEAAERMMAVDHSSLSARQAMVPFSVSLVSHGHLWEGHR